ncbi:hypothetical protein Golax_019074 [Gossypium laxum]|uniref:fructose-bisphosphate aldolase n=1 Tax=Gossypium laxum TaxID=34288 RepID=A0A7J8Z603_9ROSI|nr:hypothetical protein [Gossypium laxum]
MVGVLVEQDIVPAPIKDNGLVLVVELEILLDGDFGISRTFEVAKKWSLSLKIDIQLSLNPVSSSEFRVELELELGYLAPNPWHVSFSYARALQNTCLKKWEGGPENVKEAQDVLLFSAKANSLAQLGKYMGEGWSEEAKQGMFVKGYAY